MPRERHLKMDEYGISHDRYMELKYFCQQYYDKVQMIQDLAGCSGQKISDMPRGTTVGDPTCAAAAKRERYLRDTKDIEQAAIEAAGIIWPDAEIPMYEFLIKHAGTGMKFDDLGCPASWYNFRSARRAFYWALDKRRNG
jgi:hypothetical protein